MSFDIIPAATRSRGIKMVAGAAGIYAALWLLGFQKLFLNDGEGIAALVQIIGTLYSVVYAFATYVIWDSSPRSRTKSAKSPVLSRTCFCSVPV